MAVTTTVVAEAGPYKRPEIALYAVYVEALEHHGLASILVTPTHAPDSLPAILDHCDGLVLTGGEDIDPKRYREAPHRGLGRVNPERDEAEFLTLGFAIERELPLLAICRGCQLLNVFHGGTLYQDLTLQLPGAARHRQVEPWDRRTHRATVTADSMLARIISSEDLVTNSFHHQGIKNVAPGLTVVARADDGTVEAVEAPHYPAWLLGVQWHPERYEAAAPNTDPDRRILLSFTQAVADRARQR